MPVARPASSQQRNFEAVLAGLRRIGYGDDFLYRNYTIRDWFSPGNPAIKLDAAAFGRTPVSYDNACFGVMIGNGQSGPDLVRKYRSLGAPRAFEVRQDRILHWKVTESPSDSDLQEIFQPHEVANAFQEHKGKWRPDSVIRARNIAAPGPRQLDFVDLGLIPALEHEIRARLDPLLAGIFRAAQEVHRDRKKREADWDPLCRLVFRALAGKIFHDRQHPGFIRFVGGRPDADDLLAKVGKYYNDPEPVTADREVRNLVVAQMWESIGFENLSVEVLAYIWERTLVSAEKRKKHGIHATPPAIARYVVHRLPIESIPEADRRIVEPCCGSGTFLVAALQRLRELLPANMDAGQRHKYFIKRLSGFDTDAFGLEIARPVLMLADYPNPNGWVLQKEDVFETPERAPEFYKAISEARIVLCNPPFGDFDAEERLRYSLVPAHRAAELLLRVLRTLPPQSLLGFVLPRVFLDGGGPAWREARKVVAQRFEDVEIVSLPDKVFEIAQHETALLIARVPRRDTRPVSLFHRKVSDGGVSAFLSTFKVTREDRAERSQEQVIESIGVPDLQEIWDRLRHNLRLKDFSEQIHRGIEWNIPINEKDQKTGKRRRIPEHEELLVSRKEKSGFRKGIRSAERQLQAFLVPRTTYLCVEKQYRRIDKAFELPWEIPKAVLNKNRASRGHWRITSFPDHSGLVCYDSFIAVWPKNGLTPTTVSAILNSPIANAFVAGDSTDKNIRTAKIERIPVPPLESIDQEGILSLVNEYVRLAYKSDPFSFDDGKCRSILRRIDAAILRAYALPPRLERELLDYFKGHKRPVPFDFGDYYPEDFDAYIPLSLYDSDEFRNSTAQRFLDEFPKIDDPDILEILADL